MAKQYFNHVSSTFEAMQCVVFPILFASIISHNSRIIVPQILCQINSISLPSCLHLLSNYRIQYSFIVDSLNPRMENLVHF